MKINSYTLECYKKSGAPCFVVTVFHPLSAGVYFFNNLQSAKKFIDNKKSIYNLKYNANGATDTKTMELIKAVLNDERITIDTDGKTKMIF